MGDITRKTEQLFQVKFSDFPFRSPDTARKFGGGLSRKTKIFEKFFFQDGGTKISPMKAKS